MVRRLSVAAALWLLIAAGPAQAMGLGDIKVKSSLNQAFSASIPFTSLTPDEAANVRARLADNEAFQRAGLDRSAYVGSIRIEALTEGPNPRLELSSRELAREPLITLLVEVRTPGGTRVLREYTVLLDPAVTPATLNQSSTSSDFFETPEERASGGAARSARSSTYGPVGPTETLWMVAQAVKPTGVGLDQAMLALYEANRGAFRGGDIDALRKGSVLDVPSAERMQAVSNASARARVLELSSSETGATKAPSFSSGEPARAAAPTPPVAVAPPVTPAPAPVAPEPEPDTAAVTTTTSPAPATDGAAAPTTGDAATTTPAAGETADATATEQLPVTEGTAPATDASAPAAEVAPAATESESGSTDWVMTLIPILAGLIALLIGFAVWRSARERKAQREYEKASRESAASMPAPRVGATGNLTASRTAPSARAELEALDREMDDDATRVAGDDEDPDRTRMVTTSKIAPYTGPQAADRQMDEAERAVNTQFQANTKEINLGDNDPLSEADFHLAYGLYDEAALLLQQASARAPQRTDLRVKLAETYFAAGKPAEFEQVASGLKGEVNDEEWGKLAILGRQLSPDSALYQGGDAGSADTVLDLTFDDDATQIAPVKVDEGLEFRLEELELPTRAETPGSSSRGPAMEFDLGEFDLSGTDKSSGSTKRSAPAPEPLQLKDFDLSGTDLAGGGKSGLDVRLDELEPMVIDDPTQDEAPSSTDDAATKLDLARAYVEMGDAEMARSLLEEVAKIGNDDQKREAGTLRERLLG
jgi:FimV-like protein